MGQPAFKRPTHASIPTQRLRTVIRGAVQGVGFRPFVFRLATELGLNGWVINSAQGVFIEVEGPDEALHQFLVRVERDKPAIAYIQSIESYFLDPVGFTNFEIRQSTGGEKTALILPDLATCPDCLRDIRDPGNRRYRYPFTNCTNCGPRYTIIQALPYDRPNTTMKAFVMCQECEREYHDPADRRFHAQPNACPACGPQLELWNESGAVLASRDEALRAAADAIRRGEIIAAKGLGGFHLLVDARNKDAVARLRRRKRREEKPLALMFPSFDSVLAYCEASAVEQRLLRSPESPIVLLRRRDGASDGITPAVAPRNPYLGAMLPYTPLHHLLLSDLGFPVVATSGNISDEPICIDEHEALRRLEGIADVFLVHNRPILRHVDDSIVREVGGRELVLRRARGFAPLPVPLAQECPPVLAVGAHQKNTIAALVGRQVFVSQHIGDLETPQAHEAFQHVLGTFEQMYEAKPQAIACDLHPDYFSTRFAQRTGKPLVGVQHHYAHVLSVMAENELQPPVLGISWDGTGYGTDHTVWGGEFLRISDGSFTRVAHLRTFPLLGGDKAVRQPRRVALALLYEVFGEQALEMDLPPVRAFSSAELRVLRRMFEKRINSPLTSSAGRLFDGMASLLGLRQICSFEGQAAMELEYALDAGSPDECYPFEIHETGGTLIVDWAPMIRAVIGGNTGSSAARKFHNTLAAAIAAVALRVGEPRVALSGGCFQNKYLTEAAVHHLSRAGLQVYWHQRVPPNDGGISLGQVMAAASALRSSG
jgi:hydrogenase maturation protein HypF